MAALKDDDGEVLNGNMSHDDPDLSKSKECLVNGVGNIDELPTAETQKLVNSNGTREIIVNGLDKNDQTLDGLEQEGAHVPEKETVISSCLTNGETFSTSNEDDIDKKEMPSITNGELSDSEMPKPISRESTPMSDSLVEGPPSVTCAKESLGENGNQAENGSTFSRDSTPLSDISSVTTSRSNTPLNTCQVISSNEKGENSGTDTEKIDCLSTKSETISEPMQVLAQQNRNSEERSNDSFESCSSNSNSNVKSKGVPKARKSGPIAKSTVMTPALIKAVSSPIKNVTLNLPDFQNPITIDSKVLEKISKLGKSDAKPISSTQTCSGKETKKVRTSLPLKSEPREALNSKKRDSDGHFSDSSFLEKDAFGKIKKRTKKRKAKFGTYKLPNELKKKVAKKKEADSNAMKDSDMDEESDDMQHVKRKLCDNYLNSSNSIKNSSKTDTSPQNTAQKSAWDVLKKQRTTPKTKNTLGSTRQKIAVGRFKAQSSLDSFLSRCDSKSSQEERLQKDIPVVDENEANERRIGLRKRKKEEDDSDDATCATDNSENRSTADTNTGNKKKRKEENEKLDINNTSITLIPSGPSVIQSGPSVIQSAGLRSLLPTSVTNVTSAVKPSLVTAAHSPFLLVPVNPTSTPVVNAIPVPTSLATMSTSLSSASTTSAQKKIILSVPDQTLTGAGKTLNPPQYILMTNVNQINASNIKSVSPQVNHAPMQPQIINSQVSMPLMPSGVITPGSYSILNSSSPLATSNRDNTQQSSIGEKAPVLNRLLKQKLETVNKLKDEKENDGSLSPLPGCPSYPVTPPRTPDDQRSEDSVSTAPPGPVQHDRDEIPLCSCKINGACFKKLGTSVTYCQALDSVDGKVMGCCNKVTSSQLIRPGVKIPFMAVCEAHRKRLRLHQCCPGCGHYCTQGKFAQCRKTVEGGDNSKIPVHYFHKQCQVLRNGRYYCPHCGEESDQFEVSLSLDEPRSMTVFEEKQNKAQLSRAKMGIHSGTYRSLTKQEKESVTEESMVASHKISSDKTISTGGLPFGPDRNALEKAMTFLSEDRPKNTKKLPKLLYNPAYEGDIEKVALMLAEGCDPNEKVEDFENQTALHAACIGGHMAIVHILLQVGAFLHATDSELKTPLMYAAETGHLQLVEYLIKCKANICQRAEDGMTVLHYAAKAGHVDVMKALLRTEEISVNVQDDGGWTPIIWASEHRLVSAVKLLIQNGADPHLKDKEENTSLHWAAYSGSVDIAEMFLNAGCDLETPNEHGDRPLHIAARQDHYECVVLFLARGADVEVKNRENETPIQCCLDENSSVWLALRVNKQLKGFAASRLGRIQRVVDRDVSRGRENIPIAVLNGIDDDTVPGDFQYVTENVETDNLNINRTINSLQSCRCSDDCSSMYCVCGRNSVKCWYDKGCHLLADFNLMEPPLIFECNKGCRCWSTCNNRVVQNGIMCRLQLVKTDGRGWGVKTLLDIPKGTFICEYIGELISDSEADSREDDSYLFDLDNRDGDTYCIDARRYGNISRFINHLCEPNIIPVKVFVDHQDLRFPRICFFSSRDIKADEELGFDYGEKFWIIKWKQFTCACNSPKCKYSKDTIQKTLEEYRKRHEDEEAID